MALIDLTRGKQAIVDDCDCAWLLVGQKWLCDSRGYAVRHAYNSEGRRVMEKMHRLIIAALPGQDVDHKNLNKLDNQRSNLRIATHGQNSTNRKKQHSYSKTAPKSKFKGVWFERRRGKWRAQIRINGQNRQIGRFKSEAEAARAYDDRACEIWGDFARPNFR